MRYAYRPMTVCIAALADLGKSIVLVCDSMLSNEAESGDQVAYKMRPLSGIFQWWAMFAGDISQVPSLLDSVTRSLFRVADATNEAGIIERCVLEAYHGVRMRYATDLVLSPIGFTLARFLDESDKHPDLKEKLAAVDLGCELMVAGFDFAGDGFIITVQHPGKAINHEVTGWAAIGSGAYGATSTLMFHSVNQDMRLAQVLYHACEAKFMAESADGVGKHTRVKVAMGGRKMDPYELDHDGINQIRMVWERDGRPRLPPDIIAALDRELMKYPHGAA